MLRYYQLEDTKKINKQLKQKIQKKKQQQRKHEIMSLKKYAHWYIF